MNFYEYFQPVPGIPETFEIDPSHQPVCFDQEWIFFTPENMGISYPFLESTKRLEIRGAFFRECTIQAPAFDEVKFVGCTFYDCRFLDFKRELKFERQCAYEEGILSRSFVKGASMQKSNLLISGYRVEETEVTGYWRNFYVCDSRINRLRIRDASVTFWDFIQERESISTFVGVSGYQVNSPNDSLLLLSPPIRTSLPCLPLIHRDAIRSLPEADHLYFWNTEAGLRISAGCQVFKTEDEMLEQLMQRDSLVTSEYRAVLYAARDYAKVAFAHENSLVF